MFPTPSTERGPSIVPYRPLTRSARPVDYYLCLRHQMSLRCPVWRRRHLRLSTSLPAYHTCGRACALGGFLQTLFTAGRTVARGARCARSGSGAPTAHSRPIAARRGVRRRGVARRGPAAACPPGDASAPRRQCGADRRSDGARRRPSARPGRRRRRGRWCRW